MSKRILILLLIISLMILTFCTKKSTSPEEELLAPTNMQISLIENNRIQISWKDNSTNEISFMVDRKVGIFNWEVNYSEVGANITTYSNDIPTSIDTIYSYRVRAFDDENYSAYSDTIAWFSINSAPSNLELEQIAQDTLKLTWQDNSIGEEFFRIDRKIGDANWQNNYAKIPADTTQFIDYTTTLYDSCFYKVFAVTGISHSDSTENFFVPFLPAPSTLELQALGAKEVTLTWQDNCHNEEGYRLYIKRGEIALWDSLNLPENTQEYSDENMIPGIMNYYKICAYYENETSGLIEDEINTLPAPSNLICTQQNVHTFELTWTDNSQFEQGFKIDRKIDEEEWVTEISITEPNATTWIDSTIGRSYNTVYYRLYAFYETFSSGSIETNSNITFPAPSNLAYEKITIHSIKLTWNDNSQGETGFKIDKKVGANDWQNDYATVSENIQEWTDENAEINKNLMYKVYAYCGSNVSDYATTHEIDNTLPAPTDLSYSLDGNEITLTWQYSISVIDKFVIARKGQDSDWDNNYAEVGSSLLEWSEIIDMGHNYKYKVRAKYGIYYSEYSDEVGGGTVEDIDGNVYRTIMIGDQEWMMGNLKVTHYRNGDPIQEVTNNNEWGNLSTGAWCNYNNDAGNGAIYGHLYNWYAVDESRGLAPEGWHVPTYAEWQILVDFLGGWSVAGGKLKEAGFEHWNQPNTGATNESGFTALPGGFRRYYNGYFYNMGYYGFFWSSTEGDNSYIWIRELGYANSGISSFTDYKERGFSVRCLSD